MDLSRMTTAEAHDPVNAPAHYRQGEIECIDAIRAALGPAGFIAYCRGSALKYLWRAGLKGDAAQCLRKAEWYARRAAEEAEKDKPRSTLGILGEG